MNEDPREMLPAESQTAPGPAQPVPPRDDPHALTDARGELRTFEFLFRLGLLLGAGAFFFEAVGPPWQRNLFAVAGLLLSAMIVSTLVVKWRVLGDWRRRTQLALYAGLVLVLTIPISAALLPSLGQSAVPDSVETVLVQFRMAVEKMPGAALALGLMKGVVSFTFLGLTLVILLLGSNEGRRGGIIIVAFLLATICLFFYPTTETVAGFAFLILFFANHWETPVMIPDRLRPHLQPVQVEFLRELVREGSLSTGETRLYLENNPRLFEELLEYKLVQYDNIARDVLPGARLLHDPASEALETGFSIFRRGIWILFGLLYFFIPDLIPGPIDDFIVMALCTGSGLRIFDLFRRPRLRAR